MSTPSNLRNSLYYISQILNLF
ncbi:hypothetical protein PT2222_120276 [Paraburkholderia tropica]